MRGAWRDNPVFARLGLNGARLHGRYFYERIGVDIALEGSLAPDGALSLVEGPSGAPSGRFEGHCDAATGDLAGTWTGARATADFSLAPVTPRERPIVAKKKFAVRAHTTHGDSYSAGPCLYTEAIPEFFGLRDSEVERRLNRSGLEPSPGPWGSPDWAKEARVWSVAWRATGPRAHGSLTAIS